MKGFTVMMRLFGVMLVVAIIGSAMPLSADEDVSISIRPSVASAGQSARLKVLVARNDDNRVLIWEVDGPNYYRSSSRELDGSHSPRAYTFMVKGLPAGEYEVRAIVRRNDSSEVSDRGSIKVVGGPEMPVMP